MRYGRYRKYVIVLTAKWRRPHKPIGEQNPSADYAGKPSKWYHNRQIRFRNVEKGHASEKKGWHPEESEHHRVERAYWSVGLILAFGSMLLAGIAASGAIAATIIGIWTYREARRQSNAAEMSATSDRAVLFIQHAQNTFAFPPNTTYDYLLQKIKFVIVNYGNSPAIITNVESHLYIARTEPDPFGKDGSAAKENRDYAAPFAIAWPAPDLPGNLPDVAALTGKFVENKILPGKSASGDIEKVFGFQGMFQGENFNTMHTFGQWFVCVVHYTDIYGHKWASSYYSQLAAAGTEAAAHQQYNYVAKRDE